MKTLAETSKLLTPSPVFTAIRSAIAPLLVIGLALALQLLIKPILSDYYAKILLDIGTNAILAVSLTMVNGFTGQFSMGHAAFMLLGGYAAATCVYYGSMLAFGDAAMHGGVLSSMIPPEGGGPAPWWTRGDGLFLVSILTGGLVAAAAGYVVGLPSLRLKGDYLAIVTLGFGEIMRVLVQAQTSDVLYTVDEVKEAPWYELPMHAGGALGFSGLPFYTNLFWVFLFAGITGLVAFRIKRSTYGRAFLSIREDEIASESMGVNTTRYKIRAFVISAFFAGIAGGLFAHTVGVQLNPGELGFMKSFDIIIMVVLGGLGSISGAAIAAVILTILPEALREPGQLTFLWPYAVGMLAIGAPTWFATRSRRGVAHNLATILVVVGLIGAAFAFIAPVAQCVSAWQGSPNAAEPKKIDLSRYRMVIYALLLIMMMLLRPQGLLGVRELWDRALWRSHRKGTR